MQRQLFFFRESTVSSHRLICCRINGAEVPGDYDRLGGHGLTGAEGALQFHICPVDRFHIAWSVNIYSTDTSHPCDEDKPSEREYSLV